MIKIIILLIGFILGYMTASILLSKKKFIVSTNEKDEVIIEQVGKPKHKFEFLGEINQKQLEDIERPTALQRFLGKFKKPASKEEDEDL